MITPQDLYTAFQGCDVGNGTVDLPKLFRDSVIQMGLNPEYLCPARAQDGITNIQAALMLSLNSQFANALLEPPDRDEFYYILERAVAQWKFIHSRSRLQVQITDNIVASGRYL